MTRKKFEMDRNEVWKFEKEGDKIDGIFIARRMVNTENGQSSLNTIELARGDKKDIWGSSILDNFFGNIPIGSHVWLTYLGKAKSQKGGRQYHSFNLEYDEDVVATPEHAKEMFDANKVAEEIGF